MKIFRREGILSISVGIVYLWFGCLKFFPGLSPAEGLASETIAQLTFGHLETSAALSFLALWECATGLLLISGLFKRVAIAIALVHILLTFSPLLLLPEQVYSGNILLLTLTGQYITKNIIIVGVLCYLWSQTIPREKVMPNDIANRKPGGSLWVTEASPLRTADREAS